MSGLSREVIRWIQSLDLTWQIKTPKWDLTNGYLVAEIFSWYFPQEIQMHMYINGTSLEVKLKNWGLLENFFKLHQFDIPEAYIEGTIHCKEGAAPLLIEKIYEILTNREIKSKDPDHETDFSDRAYQVKLPMHARSTATKSVKNNLRVTELMADQNLILGQQKAQHIVNKHMDHRRMERDLDPERFQRKPTLGELAVRRAPSSLAEPADMGYYAEEPPAEERENDLGRKSTESRSRESTVQFKEIEVKQLARSGDIRHTVAGC